MTSNAIATRLLEYLEESGTLADTYRQLEERLEANSIQVDISPKQSQERQISSLEQVVNQTHLADNLPVDWAQLPKERQQEATFETLMSLLETRDNS